MSRSAPKPELSSVVHAAKYPQVATDPPFQFAPTPTLGPMPELIPPLHKKPELPSVMMAKKQEQINMPTVHTHRKPDHTGFFMFVGFLGILIIVWLYYYLRYHPGEKDSTCW